MSQRKQDSRRDSAPVLSSERTRPSVVGDIANGALTTGVIVFGVLLRFWGLNRQSFWVDENWSVGVASLPLMDSLHTIKAEIHPPLFQLLLWGWIRIGGPSPIWTRLLSALIGAFGVLASYWILRQSTLDQRLRTLIVAATASCGMAVVYAQEVRSYSLLWCAAVMVTASTIRMTAAPRHQLPTRRVRVIWLISGLVASATHLFGALIVACSALVVANAWRGYIGRLAALTGAAVAPQVAWLAFGLTVTDFAGGSTWIQAPTAKDLWQFATTALAVDGLVLTPGGFLWTSSLGVVIVTILLLGLFVGWRWKRSVSRSPTAVGETEGWYPASTLGLLALVTVTVAWLSSQWLPVWTLRNMIVVVPAVTWGAVSLAYGLGRRIGRPQLAGFVLVALMAASLVPITHNLSEPYKTDYAGMSRYLAATRQEVPEATFVGNFNRGWLLSSGLPQDAAYWEALTTPSMTSDSPSDPSITLRPGTTIYAFEVRAGDPVEAATSEVIQAAGGPTLCHQVPIFGFVAVRCDNP